MAAVGAATRSICRPPRVVPSRGPARAARTPPFRAARRPHGCDATGRCGEGRVVVLELQGERSETSSRSSPVAHVPARKVRP
eukprot:scaffold3464_cov406-Prasinococcus_capsulatus_cf.AAC.11